MSKLKVFARTPPRSADPWAICAGAALGGALLNVRGAGWLVLETALSITILLSVTFHRRHRFWIFFALGVFGVSGARGADAIGDWRGQATALAESASPGPHRCLVEGDVAASPVRRGPTYRVVLNDATITCGAEARSIGKIALYTEQSSLARGERVRAVADLAPPTLFDNPEIHDVMPDAARRGILLSGNALRIDDVTVHAAGVRRVLTWIDRARAHVRERIDATFPRTAAPLARALVLGENDLVDEDDAAFRTSGLAHLLAVSGMHLVLVAVAFERLLGGALRRIPRLCAAHDVGRAAAATSIVVTWLYADFAGGSGSALRAAWMLTVVLAARAVGRRTTPVRALALASLAAWLVDPLVSFDPSFVLSVGATAGLIAFGGATGAILVGAPAPIDRSASPTWPARAARALGVSLAATMPCLPVLATIGPSLPLGGALANLVAVPIGEAAALPLCLLHAVLAPFPALEQGCANAAAGALLLVRAVALAFASTSWTALAVPPPTHLQTAAFLLAMIALAVLGGRGKQLVLVACAVIILGAEIRARRVGAPIGELRVTMLDVGQGDALLVDFPDGRAMLVDAGGVVGSSVDVGASVVAPMLRARRRDRLAVVALSHPHPDHFGGLVTGVRAVKVDELWDTGQGDAEGVAPVIGIEAEMSARGARIVRPAALCGVHDWGEARVEVLAPCPGFDSDHGPNDNSFVIRIAYGRRAILLTGDAERSEERALITRGPEGLRADVLKVGHHGSATSTTPTFVGAVQPAIALVSSGVRNRFGHPRSETLATLRAAGAAVFRTDRAGRIIVSTDGERLEVTTAR